MEWVWAILIVCGYALIGGIAFSGFKKKKWDFDSALMFSIFWPVVLPVCLGVMIGDKIFK